MQTLVKEKEQITPTLSHTTREHSYNLSLKAFFAFYLIVLAVSLWISDPRIHWWNMLLTILWSIEVPSVLIGLYTVFHHRSIAYFITSQDAAVARNYTVNVVVPTVGHVHVLKGLQRVVNQTLTLMSRYFPSFHVDILTEEKADVIQFIRQEYSDFIINGQIRLVVVPRDYVTPNKTRHKSRANHYYVHEFLAAKGEIRPDVWIYHLDDDTAPTKETIESLVWFLSHEAEHYYMAQGIVAFDLSLAGNRLCKWADAIRPGDDVTRFAFFSRIVHSPYAGLHGEHLLVRSDIEWSIGWDFGVTLVEDAVFAGHFVERFPGKFTFLPSFTLGASPLTIKDFIRQRARWFAGLVSLVFSKKEVSLRYRSLLFAQLINWMLAPVRHIAVVLILSILLGFFNASPLWLWWVAVWSLGMAFFLYIYYTGYRINYYASFRKQPPLYKAILVALSVFVVSLLEMAGALYGYYKLIVGDKAYQVIEKA